MQSFHIRQRNIVFITLVILVPICNGLRWINPALNITICKGQDAHFNWVYELSASTTVAQISWNKQPSTDIGVWNEDNSFIALPGYKERVLYSGNGKISLTSCQLGDSGTYTVSLTLDNTESGTKTKATAKAVLSVQDWVAPSRGISINQSEANDGTCKELRCYDDLAFLGNPPVEFEWMNGDDVINGSRRDNYGYMSVCANNATGDYSCRLSGDALTCLHPTDSMRNVIVFTSIDPKPAASAGLTPVGMGLAIGIGILLILCAAVLLIICWRKRRTRQQNYNTKSAEKEKTTAEEERLQGGEEDPEA